MPEAEPVVSVVLPFFGNAETIGAAVASVLAQTWRDLELIAVDDGSPDDSAEIVAGLARADTRVRLVQQPNRGVAAARNAGVALARGHYCAFLDADDVWMPGKLDAQLRLIGDRTLVFADAHVLSEGRLSPWALRAPLSGGTYPRGDVHDALVGECFIPTPTVVLPTALVRRYGGFDVRLQICEDWDLWLRLALDGVRFDYVPEPLVIVRLRKGSLTSDGERQRRGVIALFAGHYSRVPAVKRGLVRRRRRAARKELEVFLRKRAWQAVIAGEPAAARRDLLASARSNPWSPRAMLGVVLAANPAILLRVAGSRA